jgi:hypothetical protein
MLKQNSLPKTNVEVNEATNKASGERTVAEAGEQRPPSERPRMSITTRRLLPGHKVAVHCIDDDGRHFVRLFRATWKRLPLTVRRGILRYWRQMGPRWGWAPPFIELSDSWSPHDSYGQVGFLGMELRFRQEAFARLPLAIACCVIAHELAHVYQKVCGRRAGGENERENEKHADSLIEKWGFDRGCLSILNVMRSKRGLSLAEVCEEVKSLGVFDEP